MQTVYESRFDRIDQRFGVWSEIRVAGVLCDRVRTASGSDRIMRYT